MPGRPKTKTSSSTVGKARRKVHQPQERSLTVSLSACTATLSPEHAVGNQAPKEALKQSPKKLPKLLAMREKLFSMASSGRCP